MMAQDTADKIKGALDRVVDKVNKATDGVVNTLDKVSDDTLNKLGRVEDKFAGMFHSVNSSLDELIGGHNGGPPLDDTKPKE
jgi:hypothetical protein